MSLASFPSDRTLASMTSLTRLELVRFKGHADVKPLHHLLLIELVLIDCPAMAPVFLAPGALTALQKLHIEETRRAHMYNNSEEMLDLEPQPTSKEELRKLGEAILSLPCLHQLSGHSRIIDEGMEGKLDSWHMPEYSDKSKHALPSLKVTAWRSMKVWERP